MGDRRISPGDECIIVWCNFTNASIKNLGRRVFAMRRDSEDGDWFVRSSTCTKLPHSDPLTNITEVPQSWLYVVNGGQPISHTPSTPFPKIPSTLTT